MECIDQKNDISIIAAYGSDKVYTMENSDKNIANAARVDKIKDLDTDITSADRADRAKNPNTSTTNINGVEDPNTGIVGIKKN